MKRRLITLATVFGLAVAVAGAETPAEDGKIRVLLTIGGHDFEAAPFYAVFDAMDDVEYTLARLPDEADLLVPALQERFDVIVMYDMVREINPPQQEAFAALLEQGIGVVSLHHNLGAHRQWDEYPRIIGGRYVFAAGEIDGTPVRPSSYAHDQPMRIHIADADHAITRGMEDFSIVDECYLDYYRAPGVRLLLTTNHPQNDEGIGWVHRYGNSPVFFLQLGHDRQAYEHPAFRELVHRGIRWAAGRLD